MSALWIAVLVIGAWAVVSVPLSLFLARVVARREVQRIAQENAEDTTGGDRR